MADDHINDTGTTSPDDICKYTPERTSPDILDRLIKTAPLWLGLLVLLKIIGVSAFSLTTASTLITVAPVPVLLGTLVLYEPIFIGAFAALCLWLVIQLWARGNRLAVPLVSVIALFAILLTPLQVLYLVILAVAITWLVYYIFHAQWLRHILPASWLHDILPASWLPHIHRRTTTGDHGLQGFLRSALPYPL
jgi:hypothetical protein